jgi:S-adenosylmethionine hydrolase
MSIITLTSDIGETDYYLGAVKGKILSSCPDVRIVDISNQVAPFDIFKAAFILRNAWTDFPEKTVHIVNVHSTDDDSNRILLIEKNNQYFIGFDNGLFSLVFDEIPENVYEINIEQKSNYTFIMKDIMAGLACKIVHGKTLEQLGQTAANIKTLQTLHPVLIDNTLRGNIIYTDRYGNAMTNIRKDYFNQVKNGRKFSMNIMKYERISKISSSYSDVPEGEKVCVFNAAGYLEIAINKGKASELFGLNLGDYIQIEFL